MLDFWGQLLQALEAQTAIDWIVMITALIYLLLSARNSLWCWPFGIVSCGLWAYASAVQYDLYIDALLQVFYVGMAVWGWYRWTRTDTSGEKLKITKLPLSKHLYYLLGGSMLALIAGYFFGAYTPAAATYWDAFTTVFSVIATFLLVNRRLETWLYWIVIDSAYAGLYFSRGAALFAVLMIVYVGIAAWGWKYWYRVYLDKI